MERTRYVVGAQYMVSKEGGESAKLESSTPGLSTSE